MAEKKQRPERTFIDASTGEKLDKPATKARVTKVDSSGAPLTNPAAAKKKRIIAVVLWVVGIIFEVLAILFLFKKLYFPPNQLVWLIGCLVLDLICVVIASQMWKQANDLDPASEANKTKFFIQNQLGLIISVLAFLPFIILILTNKDADKQTKTIASVVAAVCLLIAGATGIDYDPISAEDLAQEQEAAAQYAVDGNVYWTTFGTVYHIDPNCSHILNSGTIYEGSISEAVDAGRSRLCATCEKNAIDNASSSSAASSDSDVVSKYDDDATTRETPVESSNSTEEEETDQAA